MIKLIVTDLDGTLIKDNGDISGEIFQIIDNLYDKDIIFAAASGRLYSTLNKNFQKVKNPMMFIGNNGAFIQYSQKGELIHKSTMNFKDIIKISQDMEKEDLEICFCGKDHVYLKNPSEELVRRLNFGDAPIILVNSFEDIKSEIYKVTFVEHGGVKASTLDKINKNYGDKFQIALSGDIWIDMMNLDVSKGNAIKMVQNRFGISKDETLVFGDYYNDVSMFKTAHFSYAMKNAPEDVKSHANYVADSNNEDGVLNVIKKYVCAN